MRKYKSLDLDGVKFGNLTVIKRWKKRVGKKFMYYAQCECDCGTVKDISVSSLMAGRTKSCGCDKSRYAKISGENSTQWTGYKKISGKTWSSFKRRSANRGHPFILSIEEAWELFEQQNGKCIFTGLDINFGNWNTRPTASLDRIDISKGYETGNVQWVHKDINIMRNVYTVDYYINMCKLVAKKHR